MSTLDYNAYFAKVALDEKTVIDVLNDFWKYEFKIVEQFDRTIYLESYDNQELMLGVYFASYTPNKFRESELIGEDFQYRQYLTIALPKDRSNKDIVFKIISFFLHLARSKDHEMLIASPMHDDICYLNGDQVKWEETFYRNYFDYITVVPVIQKICSGSRMNTELPEI